VESPGIDRLLRPPAGLCETCGNARVIEAQTGSTFYRCRLAATDARYAKYPVIPVLRCQGYVARTDQ
jgi:hypothetical protein